MQWKKRPAARAIVIHDDKILIIKRRKNDGRQYMVTPGGGIEADEDPEQALIRELAEETMVQVTNPRLVFVEEPSHEIWGTQSIYLCEYLSGEPRLHPDSEEMMAVKKGLDWFEPTWFPLADLPSAEYPFLSTRLGEEIMLGYQNGFPDTPKHWEL